VTISRHRLLRALRTSDQRTRRYLLLPNNIRSRWEELPVDDVLGVSLGTRGLEEVSNDISVVCRAMRLIATRATATHLSLFSFWPSSTS
jgi:hypothetical protein